MQKQRDRVTSLKKLDRKIVMDSLSKQMKEAQQLQSSFQTQVRLLIYGTSCSLLTQNMQLKHVIPAISAK